MLFRSAGGGAADGTSRDQVVMEKLEDLLERCKDPFNMLEINSRVTEKSPYVVVCLQECDRMNMLLSEIHRSLNELKLGLQGALNISESMERLGSSLFIDRVPDSWSAVAYPSMKLLAAWFLNLQERVAQLTTWSASLTAPPCLWISGLFNPMSFLTAVMQVTAREHNYPLDHMALETDITTVTDPSTLSYPEVGAYVSGLFLQGARWDVKRSVLADSILKELHPALPVVHARAVLQQDKIRTGDRKSVV